MEGFTVVDAIVAIIIVVSALLAYSRGFVREAMAIAGWVGAAILAMLFAPAIVPFVKEIPVVKDVLGDNCELGLIAGFAVVFAASLVVVSMFTPLFASLVQRSALSTVDQGLGFIFGVVRGIILVVVAFFAYQIAMVNQTVDVVDQSRSAAIFGKMTKNVENNDPEQALGWITGQYEALVGRCSDSGDAAQNTQTQGDQTAPAGN